MELLQKELFHTFIIKWKLQNDLIEHIKKKHR